MFRRSRPFTAAEVAALQRLLSDLEAGNARQWYWLELAQQQPATASRRTRWLGWLLRHGGPAVTWPWLRNRLPGATLYAASGEALWRRLAQLRQDALLLALCSVALLAGFDRMAASQALLAWCIAGFGAAWQAWRTATPRPAPDAPAASEDDGELLPGPEASLGLAGMLLARGQSPQQAMTLVTALRQQRDAALAPLLDAMPELAPPPATSALRWLCAGMWLLATVPVALATGYLPSPWGVAAATGWGVLLAAASGRSTALLVGLSALLAYALGLLGHAL